VNVYVPAWLGLPLIRPVGWPRSEVSFRPGGSAPSLIEKNPTGVTFRAIVISS